MFFFLHGIDPLVNIYSNKHILVHASGRGNTGDLSSNLKVYVNWCVIVVW